MKSSMCTNYRGKQLYIYKNYVYQCINQIFNTCKRLYKFTRSIPNYIKTAISYLSDESEMYTYLILVLEL